MRMSVVPEQPRRMIPLNLNRVVQSLARPRHHSDHVILWGVRRNGEPMKMQVRHVHARIDRTRLPGLGGKIVAVRDFENVTRGCADHGSYLLTVESECIPAVFVHCMQRKGYNMILRLHLRMLRQQDSVREAQSCEKYQRTDKE